MDNHQATEQTVSEYEARARSVPEQASEVLADRASHGGAIENHRHIAALWSAYLGTEVTARNVADMMVLVKMSRASTGQVIEDHFIDYCGYAGIAWACAVAEGEAHDGE
jgi:hypothetical protein